MIFISDFVDLFCGRIPHWPKHNLSFMARKKAKQQAKVNSGVITHSCIQGKREGLEGKWNIRAICYPIDLQVNKAAIG